MAAHQAPLSLGFSRQEYFSGLPFPSPMHACIHAKSLQSCPTLCDPMDSSPPSSSVYGILHARILTGVGCHSLLQKLNVDLYKFKFPPSGCYNSKLSKSSSVFQKVTWFWSTADICTELRGFLREVEPIFAFRFLVRSSLQGDLYFLRAVPKHRDSCFSHYWTE